ncbi:MULTISPECIES: L-2-amino-thiazoline-4-carboxylic acid hydrolase [Nonomuraea]|uniref:L-2-amino-thiazoline-4-carboxylic acid hydrolase n=1 Tax=Nonomuraea mangrovi TaxID=2316207 RepID=A0ABW4SNB6_9ACTN
MHIDYDHESRAIVEAFFDRIEADLETRAAGAPAGLAARMRALQAELEAAETDLPDEPARYNLRYTSAVLAAYRVLGAAGVASGQPLIEWLSSAFVEPFAEDVKAGTRAALDAAPDPFAMMVAIARGRESDAFGALFTFEHPVDDDERFHADVRRCGYHDYLARQGAPELTAALCAFDNSWIGAIDPARDGFAFTRETTIGFGGDHCPFHFHRTR